MAKTIDKVLKDALIANKYRFGTKEVLKSVKGSKLIILSTSVEAENRSKIEEQAESSNVPVYKFDGNSFKLGKLCNKPFRISIIALKGGTDTQINSILSESTTRQNTNNSKMV